MQTSSAASRQFGRRALEAPDPRTRRNISVQAQQQRTTPQPNLAASRAAAPQFIPAVASAVTLATPSVAVAWSWRSKFWSYFKGVMAAMIELAVMTAVLDGSDPVSTTSMRINTYLPLMYFSFIMAPVLAPVIIGLAKCADHLELPRGVSDIAVGAMLMILLAIPMGSSVKGGILLVIAKAMAMLIAGAFGGFTFWRAEGYPRRARIDVHA